MSQARSTQNTFIKEGVSTRSARGQAGILEEMIAESMEGLDSDELEERSAVARSGP